MFNIYLTAFLSALASSFVFVPFSIFLSRRYGALDRPDPRKVHAEPMPRWGGLGIALSFFCALAAAGIFFPRFRQLLAFRYKLYSAGEVVGVLSLQQQFFGILCGGLVILALGMWDDRKHLPAAVKFPFQMIAAYVAMDYGVRLSGLTLPWGSGYLGFSLLASQIVTIFWLVGFMNTINLVDGLDGLAGGICAVAAGSFLIGA
jgi:UDP-GlcNAc:undecaprenyl-phosphate GlcNAc-1-phosphate transferase